MRKILLSLMSIAAVAALAFGASRAFFSDTETSTGNTFTAGALDLKVDSEAHYNGLVCRQVSGVGPYSWLEAEGTTPTPEQLAQEHYNEPCAETWAETDLGLAQYKFFDLADVKPGDEGENTISLHVYDNDAWGRFVISGVQDVDGTCTEPESEANAEPECPVPSNVLDTTPGELAENMTFYAWLDQGATPGFQTVNAEGNPTTFQDPEEGNNIWDCEIAVGNPNNPALANANPTNCHEPLVILPGPVNPPSEIHNIWEALTAVDAVYCPAAPANGHNDYGSCHGIANDGRMVGSATYYFGLAWFIPTGVGNEAQTDSLTADLSFEVVQHRNASPVPWPLP